MNVAQLAERWSVAPVVASSNLVIHPIWSGGRAVDGVRLESGYTRQMVSRVRIPSTPLYDDIISLDRCSIMMDYFVLSKDSLGHHHLGGLYLYDEI